LIQEALDRVNGYTIDRGTNIIDMPAAPNAQGQLLHLGSHPEYSKYVISQLEEELHRLTVGRTRPLSTLSSATIESAIQQVEDGLRRAIEAQTLPPEVIKELYEDGILVGRKLGMLDLQGRENEATCAC
jgi:A nuclease family of the HNH/ENDO VII superfamily with conserved AHH